MSVHQRALLLLLFIVVVFVLFGCCFWIFSGGAGGGGVHVSYGLQNSQTMLHPFEIDKEPIQPPYQPLITNQPSPLDNRNPS